MFTGLVESVGRVVWLRRTTESFQLNIEMPELAPKLSRGDSVAVNGCCLTVSHRRGDIASFDLLEETLQRTNLGLLRPDSRVNLERALRADGRLGGHFVQGHIDGVGNLLRVEPRGHDLRVECELPPDFARYVVFKGSIAMNGISLTVAEVQADRFTVWIIPHTREHTNLQFARRGDAANLEFDLIAKYVEKQITPWHNQNEERFKPKESQGT